MRATAFTGLVDCRVPVQLAGMPGVCTSELVAAVAGAGGLGMAAWAAVGAEQVAADLDAIADLDDGVVGANFLVPFLDPACLEAAASRVRVVEFFYGDPDEDLVARGHDGGALVSWQVGSVWEAEAAVDAGCDLVVAQGIGAGGHVRGGAELAPLLDAVLAAVEVPVVAAGGIGSARDVAAALEAGADGVRVGTRFAASAESGAHPRYRDALVAASPDDTEVTEAFWVTWPGAPHRVLRSCVEAVEAFLHPVVGESTLGGPARVPLPTRSPFPPTRETSGEIEAMALYAGRSVGEVTGVVPAAEIVEELTAEL